MNLTHTVEDTFKNIRSVLVVLSSKSMAYDMPGLRNLITHAYPNAAVFFISTSGDSMGATAPDKIDLVIDFTPPRARQSFFFARKMKSRSKYTVGRNSGWFVRKKTFSRVLDESTAEFRTHAPKDYLDSETYVQKKVLELAGVPSVKQGGAVQDRGKEIALEITQGK